MKVIIEREMLRQMDTGKRFSIKFVTYDAKRDKGGQVIEYDKAELVRPLADARARAGRQLTPAEERAIEEQIIESKAKNPHHSIWYTRNLRVCQNGTPTGMVRKFHPPLVLQFNGQRVLP